MRRPGGGRIDKPRRPGEPQAAIVGHIRGPGAQLGLASVPCIRFANCPGHHRPNGTKPIVPVAYVGGQTNV